MTRRRAVGTGPQEGSPGGDNAARPWPDPASLTRPQAQALMHKLRRHARPQLLEELRQLYGSDDDDVMSRAAILAGELRLQKLDIYLVSLLPTLGHNGARLGWETFRPTPLNLRRLGADAIEADFDLAYSPENHECIHGPCTLVPVDALARRLLLPGEGLTALERVNWGVPLRHRMRVRMWVTSRPGTRSQACALSGRLLTSFDRTLEFDGVSLEEHPLLAQRDYNGLSHVLVQGQRFVFGPQPDSLSLALSEGGLATCRRVVRRRPALCMAVMLDLVPIAILNWKRQRPMMCCGFRDVPFERASVDAFSPGTRLDLRYRSDRSHTSPRSGLWIGHYEFRYAPWQSDWSAIVMAESDDLATLLRILHR